MIVEYLEFSKCNVVMLCLMLDVTAMVMCNNTVFNEQIIEDRQSIFYDISGQKMQQLKYSGETSNSSTSLQNINNIASEDSSVNITGIQNENTLGSLSYMDISKQVKRQTGSNAVSAFKNAKIVDNDLIEAEIIEKKRIFEAKLNNSNTDINSYNCNDRFAKCRELKMLCGLKVMQKNCKASCGICGCVDRALMCQNKDTEQKCRHQYYRRIYRMLCPKSCNSCNKRHRYIGYRDMLDEENKRILDHFGLQYLLHTDFSKFKFHNDESI